MKHRIIPGVDPADLIHLPDPQDTGSLSVEAALLQRSSIRSFRPDQFSQSETGQLLWAAQGMTRQGGYRTAPSAGATYPLEVILAVGQVENLDQGTYRYLPRKHALTPLLDKDIRSHLAAAALHQDWMLDAAILLIITAVYERTTARYGPRGRRYAHIEAGHVAQNIHLQAIALGMATVVVGAFQDDTVSRILRLPDNEYPLLLMPVGWGF
jgi:SagB-type dehydrogenase family enzyme